MTKSEKTFTNIFLNKNWIITETPNAIEIISPEQYFNKTDDNANIGIWFSKTIAFNSIKYPNQMVIGIDFDKEYEIVTSYRNSTNTSKEIIKGKDLYDQFQVIRQQIKDKYFNNRNQTFKPNNSKNQDGKWLK
ncbi:hypothetical protein [Spiroplasma sp. AdecLV25b]|uniref:hypothetical protein n=1 Tax=Spiroplasma sp. AdecLV25b TaxID=3027162 RepID=UPI0027DED996|nr:hypothetical protein [Spiroplasma sp. AdecLV25b]